MSKITHQFLVLGALSIAVAFGGIAVAADKSDREVWYNADGEPVLAIDKKTGNKIDLEILKKEALVAKASKEAQQAAQNASSNPQPDVDAEDVELETDQGDQDDRKSATNSLIPLMLQRKGAELDNGFHWSARDTYYRNSYYGGYHGYRVIPRFSSNGYYGPAHYVPSYYPAYGHRYHRSYYHGNGHNHGHHHGGYIRRYHSSSR